MGSSAQNSSGVHWCRRRVKFNEVYGEGLGGFGAEPGQVQRDSGAIPEKVPGSLGAKPRRFRRRSGRLWCSARSGPTRFRSDSGEGSRKPWCKAKTVPEKVGEALVQSQGRLKGSGEGLGGFGAELVRFNRGFRRRFRRRLEEAMVQSQVSFNGFWRRLQRRSRRRFWESLVQVRFNGFRRRFRRRLQRRFRRSSFFFFLFSCMCTRHTWMSLEHNCALLSLS